MINAQPETLTLDRVATPTGEVLLVTDEQGAVRALDFAGYEERMTRLLHRHWGEAELVEGRAPPAVRAAVEAYFSGDLTALDGLEVKTSGTAFQRAVWAALRA
ncbi:MAG: methylated-DNA--[protein]-cysteine S-methyltransferase, partial [Brevundimonas sp.]